MLTLFGVFLAVLAPLLVSTPSHGLATPPQPPSPYLITVYAPTAEARTQLVRAGYDIVNIDVRDGTVTALAGWEEWKALLRDGWPVLDVRPFDFPPVDARYHNYQETVDDILAVADAYPHIVQVSTYGKSIEGRDLYVVKISDNVEKDESAQEPGVLIFANIHAREHLTAEQALWIIHHLAENYGTDPAVTNLVNQREIWIMPMTNPDGVEYDIRKTGVYEWWRKNRRRNPDGSFGVDLNRNFGYKWGCCGGSSSIPMSETYRGMGPFSEPETRAIRDFFLAHPSIRVSLNFHSFSELVLWPYGYTYEDVPSDMDPIDYQVMVRAGTHMAHLSRYTPMQASDLYVADGTSDDWVYGQLRIPTWTVELYPTRSSTYYFYPPDEIIPEQTARNKDMVEYLIALADEPRKVLGLAGDLITPTVSLSVIPPVRPPRLTVRAVVSDNVGVTLLVLEDVGENSVTPLSLIQPTTPISGTTAFTIPITLSKGKHTLRAIAYDRAHNRGVSPSLVIIVEKGTTHAAWLPWLSAAPGQRAHLKRGDGRIHEGGKSSRP